MPVELTLIISQIVIYIAFWWMYFLARDWSKLYYRARDGEKLQADLNKKLLAQLRFVNSIKSCQCGKCICNSPSFDYRSVYGKTIN